MNSGFYLEFKNIRTIHKKVLRVNVFITPALF